MKDPQILRASECETISADWGGLTWYASGSQGNTETMTIGRCVIKPGESNPLHHHPNCEEILVVQQGTIAHTIDEEGNEEILNEGDTITLYQGFTHQAKNVGEDDAVLFIAFSSANREVQGE